MQPNILWICSDQQRYDTIGALGNPLVRTPHIDSLVAQGVSFQHAYAQSSVCSPSRASFLTGRYPRTTGLRQNGQDLPPGETLVTKRFADAGYRCGLAGKLHLGSCANGRVEPRVDDGYSVFEWCHHPSPDWKENRYSQWLLEQGQTWEKLYAGPSHHYIKEGVPKEFHQTTWCGEKTCEFIRGNTEHPWLFTVNFYDPHHPFDPPREYLERYDVNTMPLPSFEPGELADKPLYQRLDHEWLDNIPDGFHTAGMTNLDHQYVKAAYYAMIELIDDQVGAMLQTLAETGQLERTLIVYMSDHGEMLGDHGIYSKGPYFYDPAIRVPLILSWPAEFVANLHSSAMVELVDLAPTLLQAAQLEVPAEMQGLPLTALCRGEVSPDSHRCVVFSEYYNAWTHNRAFASMARTPTAKLTVHHGLNSGELYDLVDDPHEHRNLWTDTTWQATKLDLMQQAFDASVFACDPLPLRLAKF